MRRWILTLTLLLAAALPVHAQLATGSLYGLVQDESGAPLPGASVNLTGSGAAQATVSGSDGRFRFLNLPPGTYQLQATLAGFTTLKRDNVVVTTGSNVDIPVSLKVAAREEVVTVTAETPVIDSKKTGTATVFTQDELSKIPNSRDPWALLRTVPGVVMDRVNVAGNESGQQSSFRSKGALGNDAVWNLDGINITDMAAIGASPTYFDYDAFQEIQISTSGNDIRQSTGGVGLNFVTKRGTNQFHATLRGYFTHEDLGWTNVPDELADPSAALRAAGVRPVTAETSNHNKQISDYGFDIGGPIVKDKLWFWGSYGKQDIRLIRSAGTLIDKTLLKDINAKMNWQATGNNMVSLLWFNGAKEKFNRGTGACAGCVEPASATWNQGNAAPEGWPQGLWKIESNHTFNPNFFMNAKYAYYATGFQLSPVGGLDAQAGISPLTGQTYGTTQLSLNVRPQHIANLDGNYFRAGMGGNHEFKFGAGYRWTQATTQTLWPGDQVVGYENSATNFRARVNREGLGINQAIYWSSYVGDTFTKDRLTLNLGVRWDRQTGKAVAADVQGNGAFPNVVPAISFGGYDAPFTMNDFTPRLGATFALDQSRRTLVRASVGRYVTQLATGEVGYMNPSGGQGWAEYPWVDRNADHLAQPGEVTITPVPLTTGGGFNPNNPTAVASANTIDPGLQAPRTSEFVVGLDRELFTSFAVSVAYTYRKLDRFYHEPRIGMTTADYTPRQATVTLFDRSTRTITVFDPVPAKVTAGNSGRILTNATDYDQTFSGIELSMTKRLSNKWMFRFAGSYNDHTENYDGTPRVINEDRTAGLSTGNPTRLDVDPLVSGGQVAARSAGSGFGDVFINAKWAINANAMYQLPWKMEVAANLFGKQGTPFPRFANVALGLDGSQRVLLDSEVDSERYSDLWNLDIRLAKNFNFGRTGAVFTADLFNAFNSNTELNRQRNLASTQFGLLTDNLSPRILRLGLRLTF